MPQKIEKGIYKLAPKKYEIRGDAGFRTDGSRGQFKRIVHGTLHEAREARAKMYRSPKAAQSSSITLDEFWDDFCAFMEKKVEPITLETYSYQYSCYVKPYLGTKHLKKISVQSCELCIYAAPSPSMQKKIHSLLRLLFNRAVSWKVVASSPIVDIPTPSVPSKRTQRKCNTAEEMRDIIELIEGQWFAPAIYIMIGCGARVSEACGLDGEQVDRENQLITLNQTFRRTNGATFELSSEMKTAGSERIVKVSHSIIERLPDVKGAIVTYEGKRATGIQVYRAYLRIMADSEIPYYPVKNFRHYFATEMLKNGATTADVAYAMGHSNSYITNTYIDLVREAGRVNSSIVADAIF